MSKYCLKENHVTDEKLFNQRRAIIKSSLAFSLLTFSNLQDISGGPLYLTRNTIYFIALTSTGSNICFYAAQKAANIINVRSTSLAYRTHNEWSAANNNGNFANTNMNGTVHMNSINDEQQQNMMVYDRFGNSVSSGMTRG